MPYRATDGWRELYVRRAKKRWLAGYLLFSVGFLTAAVAWTVSLVREPPAIGGGLAQVLGVLFCTSLGGFLAYAGWTAQKVRLRFFEEGIVLEGAHQPTRLRWDEVRALYRVGSSASGGAHDGWVLEARSGESLHIAPTFGELSDDLRRFTAPLGIRPQWTTLQGLESRVG